MFCALGGARLLGTHKDVRRADAHAAKMKKPPRVAHPDPVDQLTFQTPRSRSPAARSASTGSRRKIAEAGTSRRPAATTGWGCGCRPSPGARSAPSPTSRSAPGSPTRSAPASIPGPTLQAKVGDVIVAHVRNADEHLDQAITMHPHGVRYNPDYDGAYLGDYTRVGGFIAPGEEFKYTWEATPDVGRRVALPRPRPQPHWSTPPAGCSARSSSASPGAKLPDVETVLFLHALPPQHHRPGASNFQCVNGRTAAGNTPTSRAKVGQDVAFHVFGGDSKFHTFHIHGHRWKDPSRGLRGQPHPRPAELGHRPVDRGQPGPLALPLPRRPPPDGACRGGTSSSE